MPSLQNTLDMALAKSDYKSQLGTKNIIQKWAPGYKTDNEKLTESISNQFRPQDFAFSPKGDEK